MSNLTIQIDKRIAENFGKNRYRIPGCMKFKIKDQELEKKVLKRSKKALEYSNKEILRLAHLKKQNICQLCENFGHSSCPFSQQHIEEEFKIYKSQKHKCTICKGVIKNFHGFLYSPRHPDLICLTCYQAMEKGVLLQFIRKVVIKTESVLIWQLSISMLSLFFVIGGFNMIMQHIEPLWKSLTILSLIFILVITLTIIFNRIHKKKKLLHVQSISEKLNYSEFDNTDYSPKELIKIMINPEVEI
ncbi:MAG: hypothetical protein ACTSYY_00950 [Promethearchaeota archaeon]